MRPSIGRIVHYCDLDRDTLTAAIITEVHADNCVNLRLFYDEDRPVRHITSVIKSLRSTPELRVEHGCWEWPERV